MTSPLASVWTLLLTMATACSAADDGGDPGPDGGGDPSGYSDHDGTGAGGDDGDGPDDNVPNDEDLIDTIEIGTDGDLDPAEFADLEELSGLPDDEEPSLEPDDDEAAALRVAAAAGKLKGGCVVRTTLAGARTWLFFVRPDAPCRSAATPGRDLNAMTELIRLIRSVPKGGRIDGHIFNISIDGVAKALYDAQRRGVDVYISTDGQIADSQDVSKTVYLDRLKHIVYCDGNRACIATDPEAISHTKLFTFSRATQPDGRRATHVVWFGSTNQTYLSGTEMFNDTVTVYGGIGLYRDLRRYLVDLYRQDRHGDYFQPESGRGWIRRRTANVYISPELETDLINHRLDDLTPGPGCTVRVMQSMLKDNRLSVIARIAAMKEGGCDVQVVAHTVERQALARLKGAGIPVRRARVHNKVFVIKGNFAGTTKYRVYTGSHNVGIGAGRLFDEIFVKLAPESGTKHPVYNAYLRHFEDAWNGATPL